MRGTATGRGLRGPSWGDASAVKPGRRGSEGTGERGRDGEAFPRTAAKKATGAPGRA